MVPQPFYERPDPEESLRQCELISDLFEPAIRLESISGHAPDQWIYLAIPHPLAIILSQDCDLDQEFQARRRQNPEGGPLPPVLSEIHSILFCDVYTEDELKKVVPEPGSEPLKKIRQNKNERYQYLHEVLADEDLLGQGFTGLGIDFRRHFTIRADEVYAQLANQAHRRSRLTTPYMEHLSSRFAFYMARIGLPRNHLEKPA